MPPAKPEAEVVFLGAAAGQRPRWRAMVYRHGLFFALITARAIYRQILTTPERHAALQSPGPALVTLAETRRFEYLHNDVV